MKTLHPKLADVKATRQWYLIDAKDQVLGKVAARVADLLRGKTKPTWHPAVDSGDFVIIINASEVKVTGKKETDKLYYRHSGYPGGLKKESVREIRAKKPERLLEEAVYGMIPRNRLKKFILQKLHVYSGAEHPHNGQNPQALNV